MTIAAPEATFESVGRKGVSVGMSLSSLPNAPGAPSAQRGIGAFVCACASRDEANNPQRVLVNQGCIKEGVEFFEDVVLIERQMLREEENDGVLLRIHIEGCGSRAAPAKLADASERICFCHVEPNGTA